MSMILWMVFEAVAPDRDKLLNALDDHLETIETEEGVDILESELDEVTELENPHPGLEKGYSQVAETRMEIESFAKAIELIINYGPTYVQLEEPEKVELDLREAQESLQNVADTMHKYAQSGAGGVLISRTNE